MQTLEWILSTLALLGAFGLLIDPITHHLGELEKGIETKNEHYLDLACSAQNDNAIARDILIQARGCMFYPYTLHTPPNPFDLVLGGDSNHYA